jgi:hypothetical protein
LELDVGWTIWILSSTVVLGSAYAAAATVYRGFGIAHRFLVSMVIAAGIILLSILLPGLWRILNPWTLALSSAIACTVVLALSLRNTSWAVLRAQLASDLLAPRQLWNELVQTKEFGFLGAALGLFALTIAALRIWFFKSWDWDSVWYHLPITNFAIQNHSVWAPNTHDIFIRGFPRNLELLAIWNCIFSSDNRLDESPQWFFALMGSLTVVAWARKFNVSKPLALGLGLVWPTLPPIYVQIDSSHNDVACGALLSAVFYFGTERTSRSSRWMMLLPLALLAGTKTSGLFYVLLLFPWFLVRWVVELRQSKRKRLFVIFDTLASLVMLIFLGGLKYIENAVFEHNPTYPFPLHIPLLNWHFEGPADLFAAYQLDSSHPLGLFFQKGLWSRVFGSWFEEWGAYFQDVRTGGFGAVFRWVLLPSMAITTLSLPFQRKSLRNLLPLVALFFASLAIPAPWWPRYTIGIATSSLVAVGMVHGFLRKWPLQQLVSVAFVGMSAYSFYFTEIRREGPATIKRWAVAETAKRAPELIDAVRLSGSTRNYLAMFDWSWPSAWAQAKEQEFKAGDIFAYDEQTDFMAEYWTFDFRNRLEFVPSQMDPRAYVARLQFIKAKWVAVYPGPSEQALAKAGATFLFAPPIARVHIYRMPTVE